MNAHLVLEGAARDLVARADRAVVVGDELGHDEQRDTFRAGRRVGQAREHDVHDVLGEIMVARGDEDFRTGNAEGAVGGLFGLGLEQPEVGTGVRLGKAHRAGPAAADERFHEHGLLFFRAVFFDGFHRAVRQARVHGPGPVRRAVHFADRGAQRHGQVLAAVAGGLVQRRPAGLDVLLVGLAETGRRLDLAVLEDAAAFLVADGIQRRHDLLGKLAGLAEDRVDQVLVDFVAGGQ